MSETRALVAHCYELLAAREYDRLPEVFSWEVEFTIAGQQLRGTEQIRTMYEAWYQAFPDMHHDVLDIVECGDTVAVELRFTGTNTGTFHTPDGDVAPTGKTVVLESVDWIKIADGKAVSWKVYMDQLPFVTQMGLVRAAA